VANGGARNNTYHVSTSSGDATINLPTSAGSKSELDFTEGVADNQLWFLQSGNDLRIDLVGTQSDVLIKNWFSGGSNHCRRSPRADSSSTVRWLNWCRRWRPIRPQILDLIRPRRTSARFPTIPACRVRWLLPGTRKPMGCRLGTRRADQIAVCAVCTIARGVAWRARGFDHRAALMRLVGSTHPMGCVDCQNPVCSWHGMD
jgi:hypothetical protein